MTATSTTTPRQLVQRADLTDLAVAYATGSRHPFALTCDDTGEMRMICPRCGHVDHNGGTAKVLDAWRWFCWHCRKNGTRYHLERVVLEDADMLEALYEQAQA